MNEKYQIEIQEFENNFRKLKDKKIVLYGIGRYTATLLEGEKDFCFVGLMDKDITNIGKVMFGLPVIDIRMAEQMADIVIINTSETYWDVIYERINAIKIPVYYKNGLQARKKERYFASNPYIELSLERLYKQIEKAKVISFDFFDTLFMRSVCNPRDVFRLLEYDIQDVWITDQSFTEVRNKAIRELKANYSFEELYAKIEEISGLTHEIIQIVKNREISIEKQLLIPRKEILQALQYSLNEKNEVYLISDMYLPKKFYIDVLCDYGISFAKENILISNELNMTKSDGSLWSYYSKEIVKGRSAIHIGDDKNADIENAKQHNILGYLTPNAWNLLTDSSLNNMGSSICTDFDSAVMGCLLKQLFSNPYALKESDGRIRICSDWDMGYLVFGPVILTFLLWLIEQSKKDHVHQLVFMSRDGYFLKEDYEFLCSLIEIEPECCYIGISRQLAMSASITNKEELLEYISMPYSGSIPELFEDRFGIGKVDEIPNGDLDQYLNKYGMEIERRLRYIRKSYLNYLKKIDFDDNSAVVDLGYYGNNQRYLNRLLKRRMKGYYFNANLSEKNENARFQQMKACFQKSDDLVGTHSKVQQKMIFIESVLTAPHGMVREIDANGTFICAEKKQNQIHFQDKEEINQGIKSFIQEYVSIFGSYNFEIDQEFIDKYYGCCMDGAYLFADHVKQSFFNDNAMMNRIESMLFY